MYRTGLLQPKTAAGLTEEEIGRLLVLDIKDADYFQEGGAPTSMAAEICLPGIPRSWAGCSHKDEIRHKPAPGTSLGAVMRMACRTTRLRAPSKCRAWIAPFRAAVGLVRGDNAYVP